MEQSTSNRTNQPFIRQAMRSDLADIYSLVKELAIFEKSPDAVTSRLADYQSAYDEGLIEALVAIAQGKIVGMALYYTTFSTWKGKMLYLEDFYVQPEYRSRGIGNLLFQKFLAIAKSKSCKMAKWQVLDWNVKAIDFYKRQGAIIEDEWFNGKIIF